MVRFVAFIVFFALFHQAYSQEGGNYRLGIPSAQVFAEMASEPLTNAFAGVSSVKLVYQLSDGKLYYMNSKKFPLHYNFCNEVLSSVEIPEFNSVNYHEGPSRNYYLATVNFFRDAGIYTLEFSPADDISKESVEMLYHKVKDSFFNSTLLLQLSTRTLNRYSNWQVPVIHVSELFSGQKLQIIQKGKTSGVLTFVNADSLQFLGDSKNLVLLIDGNSNDIPLCRGVISTSFQTPLSHISILAQNRKTPVVALKDAHTDVRLKSFLNKKIRFIVLQDTFLLEEDTNAINENATTERHFKLAIDTVTKTIQPLKKIKLKNVATYGVKAVNFAELQRVRYKSRKITTPEGAFAIPMYYYWQHVKKTGADTLISGLLKNYSSLSKTEIQVALNSIIFRIERGKISKELLKEIILQISIAGTSSRYRFRSSSNAEDLEGFNGAGLYTSETGSDKKSIEKAFKKVWASLWSERAFEERCNAGIDHSTTGMAILAHRSFPEEYINGVAITRNLYRDFDFGFVVNLQAGDNSLVKPTGNETCEQFISYFNTSDPFFNDKEAIEYLSFSSLNNNAPLLTRKEVFELTQQLDRIKRRFYRKYNAWKKIPYKDFAMDVEFKAEVVNNRRVFYFKQARPFN